MEKYKKLLESEIPGDVALGLFLTERDNLLQHAVIDTKCKATFIVNFDAWTCWIREHGISIHSMNGRESNYRFQTSSDYYPEFDFRTKKEE